MKRSVKVSLAVATAIGLAVAPATAAFAAPWDGNNVTFMNGVWELSSGSFVFDDVYVIDPANSSSPTFNEYTDIWDTAGEFYVSLDGWTNEDAAGAADDASVDVTDDAATGDKVFTADMVDAGTVWDGQLDISGEMRIFAAGDLIRSAFFVKNTTASPVTASFRFYTNWGSGGEIYSYQGQDDSILAVPAAEDSTSSDALAAANVQWVVHTESDDAPGAMAFGLKTASNPGVFVSDDDDYRAYYDDVVVPAGATIAFAVFHNWTPSLLISNNYDNDAGDAVKQATYAAAATTAAAEFDSFSGRLTNGLTGYDVVNWVDVSSAPQLPDTGFEPGVVAGYTGLAVLLLVAGGTIVLLRRRAHS